MADARTSGVLTRPDTALIIGGGGAGIAVGKALALHGLPFDIVERESDFGGNWNFGSGASRVYRSTHLISSRTNTQFSDYPMPDDYPQYPSHTQFLAYLRNAARHFGLYERALFGTEITRLQPESDGWLASLSDGTRRWYPEVVVANGLLREPYLPRIPGSFSGTLIHSSAYTEPEIFHGRRVLIVGGGNSGCDIATDSARCALRTCHSIRRGYHFMPKFIAGKPTQDWLMEIVSRFDSPQAYWAYVQSTFKLAGFDGRDYGLPEPDHEIHQAHPVMNSTLLYHIGHGDIAPKPDVARFDGDEAVFADGSRERFDVVVLATGYQLSLPFLDPAIVDWTRGLNHLFLNCLPMEHESIVFAGYFNIPSGFGNLANTCARFIANYLQGRRRRSRSWSVLNRLKHRASAIDLGQGQFLHTRRHAHELDLWKYVKTVNFLNERLEAPS